MAIYGEDRFINPLINRTKEFDDVTIQEAKLRYHGKS
jgi:hypothetical protein